MNFIVRVIVLSFICTGFASAQNVGFTFGGNNSVIKGGDDRLGTLHHYLGFNGGIAAFFPFLSSRSGEAFTKLFFLYSYEGFLVTNDKSGFLRKLGVKENAANDSYGYSHGDRDYAVISHNLKLPVLLGYHFYFSEYGLGPYFGGFARRQFNSNLDESNISYDHFSYGLSSGLSFDVSNMFQITAGFEWDVNTEKSEWPFAKSRNAFFNISYLFSTSTMR
ncbi:MAG: hypothetical protein MJZ23_02135 [Paludibacteraceae bacterium]|nr:hypothetical protein [Paludibacteraceae bacterium]